MVLSIQEYDNSISFSMVYFKQQLHKLLNRCALKKLLSAVRSITIAAYQNSILFNHHSVKECKYRPLEGEAPTIVNT